MNDLLRATVETIHMTVCSVGLSYLIGLPLGVLTCETAKNGLFESKVINSICNFIIGTGRAIPFTILMVLALPLTRILVGTGIGTTATIIPLTLAAIPFVARTIEQSLMQVDYWVVKAAQIDNASKIKIIVKIKIGSRLFDIMSSLGLTSIAIISYTCMAGAVGGGGLGNYALTHGFYRYDWFSVLYATLIIIAIVLVCQYLSKLLSRLFDYRKNN